MFQPIKTKSFNRRKRNVLRSETNCSIPRNKLFQRLKPFVSHFETQTGYSETGLSPGRNLIKQLFQDFQRLEYGKIRQMQTVIFIHYRQTTGTFRAAHGKEMHGFIIHAHQPRQA